MKDKVVFKVKLRMGTCEDRVFGARSNRVGGGVIIYAKARFQVTMIEKRNKQSRLNLSKFHHTVKKNNYRTCL